jgi:DNA-binding Xre family transcriptional regulator
MSKVTDYMIRYLEKNGITPQQIELETGISAKKVTKGYQKPLDAEEFLTLCAHLQLSPEDVLRGIRSEKSE